MESTDHFAGTWTRARTWSAVERTFDNVVTFDCQNLVATGSTQGTAALIASDTVNATSTGANQGIILPAACNRIVVKNANSSPGNAINVYPPSGAKISSSLANVAVPLPAGNIVMFVEITSTQWNVLTLS
jgi:hypothetical protein